MGFDVPTAQQAKTAYQNTMIVGSSPAAQIILIYEGIIRTLYQLQESIAKNDIQARYNQLTIAAAALLGLQQGLNMDVGGEPAKALMDFYKVMYTRVMRLHVNPDSTECATTIQCLQDVLEGWRAAERQLQQSDSHTLSSTSV